MAYYTEADLERFAASYEMSEQARLRLRSTRAAARKSVFLSHSHKDKVMAKGLRNLLASQGVDLYIDWEDASMPNPTNRETAEKLKARIRASDYLLVLATENGCASRWVPWEIGIADSQKDPDNILILPVADRTGRFHGNEYLQLYRRLETSDIPQKTGVFAPNATRGVLLESLLR